MKANTMKVDIELTAKELAILEKGGFITMILHDGMRVIIKKDVVERSKHEFD